MPPEAQSLTGTVLGGRYRVGRLLGAGGMGAVYEAVQEDLGRRVAIKVLHVERAREVTLKRFRREAESAAALGHPNIVNVTDFAMNPGEPAFLVMERLDGLSLADVIEIEDQLAADRVVFIMTQVLDALRAAHGAGIIHRDIKPDNIFLTSISGLTDVVKVLDFGIAKMAVDTATQLTGENAFLGTPAYMAPEQARAGTVDPRTDIYAVGACMYTALTGEPLFPAAGQHLMFMILQTPAPSVRKLRPDVHENLAEIIARSLSKDPNERFQTAEEMMNALSEWAPSFVRKGPFRATKPPSIAPSNPSLRARALSGASTETAEGRRRIARANTITSNGVLVPPSELPGTLPPPRSSAKHTLAYIGAALAMTTAAVGLLTWPKFRNPAQAAETAHPSSASQGGASPNASQTEPQCVRNDDCASSGTNFVCGRSGTCIPRKSGCGTNKDCIDTHNGEPWTCEKETGTCKPLASEDCTVIAEKSDIEDDATFWVGTMFPLKGPKAGVFGIEMARGADLGRRDFMSMIGGIPLRKRDRQPHPIGIVECDDATNPVRVARHLAEVVGVPAVIGFGASEEVVQVSTQVFLPKGTLVVAAPNRSSLINAIPQPASGRLVYRTTPGDDQYSEAIAAFVDQHLEPKIRRSAKVENLRIALVRYSTHVGLSFADSMLRRLRFNGKPAAENGSFYRQWSVEPNGSSSKNIVDELQSFRPHIVLSAIEVDEFTERVLRPLEASLAAGIRPHYVLTGGGGWWGASFFEFVGTDSRRRQRFWGVDLPSGTVPSALLAARYNETFKEKLTPAVVPSPTYDALYAIAYSAVATNSPWTGQRLAQGMVRIQSGTPVDVGAVPIPTAVNALQTGGGIDLTGARSRLNFNGAGEPSTDEFVFTCLQADDRGRVIDSRESGLRYHIGAYGKITGEITCE